MILNVDVLARALPDVMDQETCDEVMGLGFDPLDVAQEWYETPRDLATAIAAEYARLLEQSTDADPR